MSSAATDPKELTKTSILQDMHRARYIAVRGISIDADNIELGCFMLRNHNEVQK